MDQRKSMDEEGLPRSFKVWAWQKFDRALDEWLGLFVIILALAAATWFGVGMEFQDWLKETKPKSPPAATGAPAASGTPVATGAPIAAIPGPTKGVTAAASTAPRAAATLIAPVTTASIAVPTTLGDARVIAIPIPAAAPTFAVAG